MTKQKLTILLGSIIIVVLVAGFLGSTWDAANIATTDTPNASTGDINTDVTTTPAPTTASSDETTSPTTPASTTTATPGASTPTPTTNSGNTDTNTNAG